LRRKPYSLAFGALANRVCRTAFPISLCGNVSGSFKKPYADATVRAPNDLASAPHASVRPDQQDEFVVDVRLSGRFELGTRFRHINNAAGRCGQLIFETQFSGISKGATLVFPSFGSREILKSISPNSPGPPRL